MLELKEENIDEALKQVVTELQTSSPDADINFRSNLAEPVNCDIRRISQLFSNLLGNALTHGDKSAAIEVNATSADGVFELAVSNKAPKIPEATLKQLFQPFSRGKIKKEQQGLGLGLYIASEIANAHGGTLTVNSTEDQITFTFRLQS